MFQEHFNISRYIALLQRVLFSQARTLGDVLVVGVNPDAEIRKYKGPPVMNDDERCALVEAVKWVDEVIPSVLLSSASE